MYPHRFAAMHHSPTRIASRDTVLPRMAFVHNSLPRRKLVSYQHNRLTAARPNRSLLRHPVMCTTSARCRISLSKIAVAVGFALSVSIGSVPTHAAPQVPTSISKLSNSVENAVNFKHPSARDLKYENNDAQPITQSATQVSMTESKVASFASTEHKSLGERIADSLRSQGLSDEIVVFLVSALPVVELRAGVPIGFVLGLSPITVFILAVLGNMAPIVLLLLLLRIKVIQKIASRVLERARDKAASVGTSDSRAKALALFVGVPLPGTGAWTGCIVAFLLGMPIGQSLTSLFAGVVMSASIMTVLCALGRLGAAIAGTFLLGFGISSIMRSGTAHPDDSDGGDHVRPMEGNE